MTANRLARRISRRRWLAGSGAVAGGALLADVGPGSDELLADPTGQLLFVSIAAETIPESISRVRTNGFDRKGFGAGSYRLVAASDSEASARGFAPSAWTARSRNGRWYSLEAPRDEVMLSTFGGRGDGSLAADRDGALRAEGGTDSAAAWDAFGDWARANASGRAVTLRLERGVYLFDLSRCWRALLNIPKLRLIGSGSTLQNTYETLSRGHLIGGSEPFFRAAYPRFGKHDGALIHTTREGDRAVALKDPDDTRMFAESQWVLIGSLDVQYSGFPPNMYQFEYLQIAGIDAEKGLLGLSAPVRYRHADDFPDGPAALPCGRARVWRLEEHDGSGALIPYRLPDDQVVSSGWDVDHTYADLQVNLPEGTRTYASLSGRRLRTERWRGCGFSEGLAQQVSHYDSTLITPGEPDKLVESLTYDGLSVNSELPGGSRRLTFQSPIRNVVIRNSTLTSGLTVGQARNLTVTRSNIGALYTDSPRAMGLAQSIQIDRCQIHAFPRARSRLWDGSRTLRIDGAVVRYRDGVFLVAGDLETVRNWQCVPGVSLNLLAACGYSGPEGDAYVRAVWGAGEGLRIETSLPFESLPAWSTGEVCFFHQGRLAFVACDGSAEAREATRLCESGSPYYDGCDLDVAVTRERRRRRFEFGVGALKRASLMGARGLGGDARVAIGFQAFKLPQAELGQDNPAQLTIEFACGAPRADVTRSGWLNRAPGDTVRLAGQEVPALPSDRILGSSFVLDTDFSGIGRDAPREVSLQLWFDVGDVRRAA